MAKKKGKKSKAPAADGNMFKVHSIGRDIATFCERHLGVRVGNGSDSNLAFEAIINCGGDVPAGVEWSEYEVGIADLEPGDILQWNTAEVEWVEQMAGATTSRTSKRKGGLATGALRQKWPTLTRLVRGMPSATSVVKEARGEGIIIEYHQGYAGCPYVYECEIYVGELLTGNVKAYRIYPRGYTRDQQFEKLKKVTGSPQAARRFLPDKWTGLKMKRLSMLVASLEGSKITVGTLLSSPSETRFAADALFDDFCQGHTTIDEADALLALDELKYFTGLSMSEKVIEIAEVSVPYSDESERSGIQVSRRGFRRMVKRQLKDAWEALSHSLLTAKLRLVVLNKESVKEHAYIFFKHFDTENKGYITHNVCYLVTLELYRSFDIEVSFLDEDRFMQVFAEFNPESRHKIKRKRYAAKFVHHLTIQLLHDQITEYNPIDHGEFSDGVVHSDEEFPEPQLESERVGSEFSSESEDNFTVSSNGLLALKAKIQFAPGSSALPKSAYKQLDSVAKFIRSHDDALPVVVQDHTFVSPSTSRHSRISGFPAATLFSQERAENVKKYLVKRKIPEDEIEAHGAGDSAPVFLTGGDYNVEKCERVEFWLGYEPPPPFHAEEVSELVAELNLNYVSTTASTDGKTEPGEEGLSEEEASGSEGGSVSSEASGEEESASAEVAESSEEASADEYSVES